MSIEMNIPFLFHPREQLFCSGQPDIEGLQQAIDEGVRSVINLRPDAEMEWDEGAWLDAQGIEYLQLPVASAADLNPENARKLGDWLQERADQPVLLHCASSNRVGALLALHATLEGVNEPEALALGRASGLTKLEPAVRALIQQWAAT